MSTPLSSINASGSHYINNANNSLASAKVQAKTATALSAAQNASEYQANRASDELLAKMKIYKPAFSFGLSAAPAKGSFAAPIQLSYANANKIGDASGSNAAKNTGECSTCAQRAYKDGSDDSGVSFQTAKSVPASTAGVAVASHEGEHVTRETAKAREEGRIVTQAKVTFQYACCPECHKMYIAGGTTTISTVPDTKAENGLEFYGEPGGNADEEF